MKLMFLYEIEIAFQDRKKGFRLVVASALCLALLLITWCLFYSLSHHTKQVHVHHQLKADDGTRPTFSTASFSVNASK